jgi:solute carrier family 25 carnitine/acylcarnitine transporter 20/29
MDLVKVRQQTAASLSSSSASQPIGNRVTSTILAQQSSSTFGMLRNIMVREGLPGLYQGITAPLVAVVPAFAVMFWSYDLAKSVQLKRQQNPADELSLGQIAAAGAFSGVPFASIVGPLERFKCLMQVDKIRYSGFGDCVRQVYREGGLRSVFRGTGMTVIRDVPGNAIYFAGYEFWRQRLCEWQGTQHPTMGMTFFAGGMAGVGNWIVACPFDVVKSIWQTAPAGTYSSPLDVARKLLEKVGPSAFFRGLSPALLRAFPANAACLLGAETARSLLPEAFPSSSA